MKKEAKAKSKLWLWLGIGLAALAVVAGVLAFVLPGLMEGEQSNAVQSDLYWNLDGKYYMEISDVPGFSAREPAEDGNYYIRFAFNGKVEELHIIDKQLVNYIDNMELMGLVFDADGVVIDALDPKDISTELAKDFYVERIEGNKLTINSSVAMNGMKMELELTDETYVFDVAPDAEELGTACQIQVLDRVSVYAPLDGTEPSHVYVVEHPEDAKIYWRVEKLFDTETKLSTRVPDENGVYTMEFAHNGEIVELKCKDVSIVNEVDSKAVLIGQFAFTFDEEGYIEKSVDVGRAVRGKLMATDYHITAIDGDTYTATRLSAGSDQGKVVTFKLAQDSDIFQCCQYACYEHNCGERIDSLQLNDRVNIYANMDDEAKLVFVTRRTVDSPMYYNYARSYGGNDKGTNRTPVGGYYDFELLADGKIVKVRAPSKEIADQMDSVYNRCLGLKLNGNVVERVYDATCVYGGANLGTESFVETLSGPIITIASSFNDSKWNSMLSADCKVYNAITGEYGKQVGGEMDLRVGDQITAYRNVRDEIQVVFVMTRPIDGGKVYYNLERKFDTATQTTKRELTEDGFYEFLMASEGKQVTVKTKNKGMASFIDEQLAPLVGLRVGSDGVIRNAYTVTTVLKQAAKACNYRYVENVTSKSFNTYYIPSATNQRVTDENTWTIAKNCKVYNVSTNYKSFRGEPSKLEEGDYIQAIKDLKSGEIIQIWVMQRNGVPVDVPLYYHVQAQYDSTNEVSTRQPDAEGWYVFDLIVDGEVKQYKTKNTETVNKIDAMLGAFTFYEEKGEILRMLSMSQAMQGYKLAGWGYEVVSIADGKVKITKDKLNQNAENTVELPLSKDFKAINVIKTTDDYTKKIPLNVGDQGLFYQNSKGELIYGFIRSTTGGALPYDAHCSHCNKTVNWQPFGGKIYEADAHYFLPMNSGGSQATVGMADGTKTNAVLDLQGHTYTGTGRVFLVYGTLTIMDTVGGGKLKGTTPNDSGTKTSGSCIMVGADGKLVLQSGELTTNVKDGGCGAYGGVVYVSGKGEFVMNGGTVQGGTASERGGNVHLAGEAYFTMNGGTIKGGDAPTGANVLVSGKVIANINGGTIEGGVTVNSDSKVTLSGAPVISGDGMTIISTKLQLGQLKSGASIVVNADGIFTEENDNIEAYAAYFKPVSSEDTIEIKGKALLYNKKLPDYNNVDNSNLVFDAGTKDAYCAVCEKKVTWIQVTADAPLVMSSSKHYYLASNLSYTGTDSFIGSPANGSACLHLNGHNVTATNQRVIQGRGGTLNILGNGTVCGGFTNDSSYILGATVGVNTNIAGGSINLIGGNYISANTKKPVVSVSPNGGRICMYKGATITGSADAYSVYVGKGDAVDAEFYMFGGKIQGGIVYAVGATNTAGNACKLNISGGTITSGVEVSAKTTVKLAGAPAISGTGLRLPGRLLINIDELQADASILIKSSGVFTEASDNASSCIGCFTPANAEDTITLKDNALKYNIAGEDGSFVLDPDGDGKAVCPVCGGEEVQWIPIATDERLGTEKSGHYYLETSGTDSSAQFATVTQADAVLCIHMNGKNLTTSGRIAVVGAGGTINIMGGGSITGSGSYNNGTDTYTDATLVANSTGAINVYDTTIRTTAANKPVGLIGVSSSAINLYDGAVIESTDTNSGVLAVKGKVSLNGTAKVTGTGVNGIAIASAAKLTVNGNWTGSATVAFEAPLADGIVSIANGASTGAFTGELTLETEGNAKLVGKGGRLALENATVTPAFVLDPDGDNKAVCPVCGGEEVEWTAVAADTEIGEGKSGHYYLSADSNSTFRQFATVTKADAVLCIHLNGKNVTTAGRIAVVGSGGTINIMGEGTVTSTGASAYSEATLWVGATGSINLYGGTYKNSSADKPVASIGTSAGNINLYDGTIIEGTASNKAINALKGNVSLNGTGKVTGSAIEVAAAAKLTVNGNWTGSATVKFASALVEGVVPADNGASTGNFTGALTLATDNSQLVAKDGGLAVKVNAPAFALDPDGDGKAVCPACGGEEVEWTAVAANKEIGEGKSGHFYLTADSNSEFRQYATTTAKDAVLCIHLNGKNVTTAGRIAVVGGGGTINIMGEGTVTSNGTSAYSEATLVCNSTGAINLYGGTYKNSSADKPVASIGTSAGNINLYDGAIIEGTASNKAIDALKGNVSLNGTGKVTGSAIEVAAAAKLTVNGNWTGSATVKFASALVEGVVPADNGASTGNFTGTLTLATNNSLLVAKDGGLAVTENAPAFVLDPDGDGKAVCPACGGEEVQWTAVAANTRLGAGKTGHYYLEDSGSDNSSQFATIVEKDAVLCIYMNGKDLTTSGRIAVVGAGGTINIMGGGSITGTGAYNNGTDAYTDAVLVANSTGSINVYGTTIRTTAAGKPVAKIGVSSGAINLYDGAVIEADQSHIGLDVTKGNVSLSGTANAKNIQVAAAGKLTVNGNWTGSATVKFASALVEGVVPAANGASTGNFTGTLTLATDNSQLVAKNGGLAVKDETEGKLVLDADNNGYCEACGKTVQWTDLNSLSNPRIGYLNSKPSGVEAGDYVISEYYHFFLSADLNYTRDVQFAERYYNVNCLHLNGHNLSVKARLRLGLGGTMNIMGSGSITGSCNSTDPNYNQSLFYLNGGAVLNLYGGTYTSTNPEAPAILLVDTKATTVNICGDVTVNGGVRAANGIVTLGLGAKVDTIDLSNIAKINVLSDWTGTASVKFATAYADGTEIPAANAQCGTLTDGVFIPGGSYAGNLFTQAEPPQHIVGDDGKMIVNPNHSQDNVLKVLGIGNSYTIDSMHLLYEIYKAEAPEQNVQFGFLYYPGCNLSQHVQFINNDEASYVYYKMNNETGKWVQTANSTAADALEDEAWDIVTLQQSSANSGRPETYNADIQTIQNYVTEALGYTPEFLWNMTWAYAEGYNNSYYVEGGTFSQAVMYKAITDTVQAKIVPDSSFSGVIPAGTAIQNARTYWEAILESDAVDQQTYAVSRPDGTHLTNLGRFIAAYTWYCAISGETVDTLALTEIPSALRINWGVYSYTQKDAAVIAEAVRNAIATPYAVTAVSGQ